MFALVAAVLFVVGLPVADVDHENYLFWLGLGLAAWALDHSGIVEYLQLRKHNKNG